MCLQAILGFQGKYEQNLPKKEVPGKKKTNKKATEKAQNDVISKQTRATRKPLENHEKAALKIFGSRLLKTQAARMWVQGWEGPSLTSCELRCCTKNWLWTQIFQKGTWPWHNKPLKPLDRMMSKFRLQGIVKQAETQTVFVKPAISSSLKGPKVLEAPSEKKAQPEKNHPENHHKVDFSEPCLPQRTFFRWASQIVWCAKPWFFLFCQVLGPENQTHSLKTFSALIH